MPGNSEYKDHNGGGFFRQGHHSVTGTFVTRSLLPEDVKGEYAAIFAGHCGPLPYETPQKWRDISGAASLHSMVNRSVYDGGP